jgi:hypothetical protein
LLEGEIIETGIGYVYKKKLQNLRELFIFKKENKKPITPPTGNNVKKGKPQKGEHR